MAATAWHGRKESQWRQCDWAAASDHGLIQTLAVALKLQGYG